MLFSVVLEESGRLTFWLLDCKNGITSGNKLVQVSTLLVFGLSFPVLNPDVLDFIEGQDIGSHFNRVTRVLDRP